jgi:hypothetical protein
MSYVVNDSTNEKETEIQRAVMLLMMRDRDNDLRKTIALEYKIKQLPKDVKTYAKNRLALRRQNGGPGGEAGAALAALRDESGGEATLKGALRELPNAAQHLADAVERSGMMDAIEAATETAMPGAGTAIGQAPKIMAAPKKVFDAGKIDKQRKEVKKVASDAQSRAASNTANMVLDTTTLEAQAAVRQAKANVENRRYGSGAGQADMSERTGQNQYFVDPDDVDPYARPSGRVNTTYAAAEVARDVSDQLKKKRNKKLVDAGSAFVPKLDQFLKLRRMVRGDAWTALHNEEERLRVATILLELAYKENDRDAQLVMEELVPKDKERDELRNSYKLPALERTAAQKLSEKLRGRAE